MTVHLKKTTSFAVIHFIVAFSVSYALTGSLFIASALALIEPALNTIAFFFHELYWSKHTSTANQTPVSSAPTTTLTPSGAET